MYAAERDPYCYPNLAVLVDIPGLRDQGELDRFEALATAKRLLRPPPYGDFSARHYRSFHRHIFQDVYDWSGDYRTVRISKGASMFCFPEHIANEMDRLFLRSPALTSSSKAQLPELAASFLADLNAIHPFREGNGRTQLTFIRAAAAEAGHPLDLRKVRPKEFLAAMIASFSGREDALREEIARLV